MEMKKLDKVEAEKLRRALDANALSGSPLIMDPATTSFVLDDRQVEEDIINSIKSVPVHY